MLYRAPVDTSPVTEGVTLFKHQLLLLLLLLLLVVKGIVFAPRLHSTTHKFSRRASSMTKDEGCFIYAVTRCSLFDDRRRYLPLTFYLVVFFKKLTFNR